MKVLLVVLLVIVLFISGMLLGDRIGTDTRAYYDAPGKIKILSSVLDKDVSRNWVQGEITKQVRILNEPEITGHKSQPFLLIMENGDDFSNEYEKYSSVITTTKYYRETMAFLCKHNEQYEGKCEEKL